MSRLFWATIALLGPLGPAHAQILLNPPKSPSVITVDVDLVNVLCTVRDKNGAYVKGLTKDDFEIREDGRRQQITHFAREVDSPMTVALLLDVSGSVANILDTEKTAAGRFFSEVLRPGDQALLAGFAQLIAVWQDLTPSAANLQAALDRAQPFERRMDLAAEARPRGGTLLYDAVNLVAAQKLKQLAGRKTMVLITDGEDNGSLIKLQEAAKAAQEADAVVYGIHYEDHFPSSSNRTSGMKALTKLSEPTGGQTFHVSRKLPLETIFDTIGEEMRNQYSLGYTPPDPAKDGAFHRLEIKISQAGLKPQARAGYYSIKR